MLLGQFTETLISYLFVHLFIFLIFPRYSSFTGARVHKFPQVVSPEDIL